MTEHTPLTAGQRRVLKALRNALLGYDEKGLPVVTNGHAQHTWAVLPSGQPTDVTGDVQADDGRDSRPTGETPTERRLRTRLAGQMRWAKDDPVAHAHRMQAGLVAKFEREADPDGTLEPAERARRAAQLRKAHMTRLSPSRPRRPDAAARSKEPLGPSTEAAARPHRRCAGRHLGSRSCRSGGPGQSPAHRGRSPAGGARVGRLGQAGRLTGAAWALADLGDVRAGQGREGEAARRLAEALELFPRLRRAVGAAHTLHTLEDLAARQSGCGPAAQHRRLRLTLAARRRRHAS